VNPEITQDTIRQTICNPRWSTKTIRPDASYTHRLKVEQIREYAYSDSSLRDYEEDHFIPLELGGSPTDPKNLWPEPFETSVPDGGAHAKDEVENYLHAEVCSGSLTLDQARADCRRLVSRLHNGRTALKKSGRLHHVEGCGAMLFWRFVTMLTQGFRVFRSLPLVPNASKV
jgi:hypothetical protein